MVRNQCHFSLKPAFDEQGNVVMLIPEGRDITDRKLAEQKIREQATLLDIASDAIFVRDLNHHILYWNQGAEGIVTTITHEKDLLQGNREMVLIVEDDLAVQSSNRSLLDSYHYKTLVASNGLEAVNIYNQYQQEIEVVLMDIMMPNMDGITAIHTLATMNPQVKIITMSGLSLHRDATLAAGALVFLPKPYALEELVRSLYELVRASP